MRAVAGRWKTCAKRGLYALAALALLSYVGLHVLDKLYPPDLRRYEDVSTVVTDRRGQWLRVYLSSDDKYRIQTARADLPEDYLRLLINYEDKDFYTHNGIDVSAIFRALGQNLSSGRVVSGASTLSMQTARLLMPTPRTLRGKIRQAFRAWQLERRLSKNQILSIYATLAPVGGNREGLTAASYYYLNKPVDKLSLGESAWLVALTQSPEKLSHNKLLAKLARDKVLKRALDNGIIDTSHYRQALAEPLVITPTAFPFMAPHRVARAKRAAVARQQRLKTTSPQISTTPTKTTPTKTRATKPTPSKITPSKITLIKTTLDSALQRGLQQVLSAQLPQQHAKANLAGAIMDNASGQWLAYVGSADFFNKDRQGQVDMLQAVRSPGSTLKPFITLFAFDWLHFQPQTTIDDTPMVAGYQPSNYDGRYDGRITLAEALRRSRNVPAVRLLRHIQPDYFAERLQRAGVKLYLPRGGKPNLSLALGGVGVRGAQLARLYRQLARCSFADEATADETIVNERVADNPLEKSQLARSRLADSKACKQVTQILQHSGDGQGRLYFGREPVAFKTGTAYGWRDRWIFAYSKAYTIVLWSGRADGQFAEQRASAEALIPVLRQVLGLLPNPPARAPRLGLGQAIANQHLPPRLRHVASAAEVASQHERAGKTAAPRALAHAQALNALTISAPLDNAVIEWQAGMPLSFRVQGGKPPYIYLLNEHLLTQTPETYLKSPAPSAGSYHLLVIDAEGNSAATRFRLQPSDGQSGMQSQVRRARWQ